MKLTKVAFAIASVLAVAAGSAYAGQIDSSSTTLAREVIYSDAQVVRAPSKSYSFSGVIDARTNEQRLQLQWTLSGGLKWSRLGDVALTDTALTNLALTGQDVIKLNGKDLANANIGFNAGALVGGLSGVTIDAFLANSDSTLVFNITIPAAATNYIKDAVFQINAEDFAAGGLASNVGITNALSVAKAVACVAVDTNADINFKHFTNHNGNTSLISGLNPDSEHVRNASTNDGRYVNFTENVRFTFANGIQSQTDAATLRRTFLSSTARGLDYAAAVTATGVGTDGRLHRISTGIDLAKVAAGLDLNYINQYGNGVNAVPFEAGDFDVNGSGNLNTGVIDAARILISVKSPLGAAGVAAGSTVALLDSTDATIAGAIVTPFDVNGVATISLPAAVDMAALANLTGGRLYYVVNGTAEIPQNATFEVTATLDKDDTGALREQDNVCKADLAGVGGGIKIDVRNYAAYATFGDVGPSTTVRIINNSETQSADVYGQMIYADGTYGAWGKLADLKPREVLNMANKEVEAKLVNAAAATNPFGAGALQYAAKGGTSVVGGTKAGISDRLRIVSNTGTTLRVQSYMVVGNSVIDTSNAQGVDFENTGSRVPVTAVDAQPVSQDAINGLGK